MSENRLSKNLLNTRDRGGKCLMPYITAALPDLQTTADLVRRFDAAGCQAIEIGFPFSDSIADGPVIQRSSARALKAGMTVEAVFDLTRKIRQEIKLPIVLFSYYNPVFIYGGRRFYENALKAGADGLLVVDLPPEESDELMNSWPGRELSLIRLVAPTTPRERMAVIEKSGDGFLYLISKTGITGSDGLDVGDIKDKADTLRSVTSLPICVGFGISTPEEVAAVADIADGVVIGSAFERVIEENIDDPELPSLLSSQVSSLKAATLGKIPPVISACH